MLNPSYGWKGMAFACGTEDSAMKEIGKVFGIHSSMVSRAIRRFERYA